MLKKKKISSDPVKYLMKYSVWNKTPEQRAEMTVTCKDSDYIPKVKDAGKIVKGSGNQKYQIMHNGMKVLSGGYYGEWMSQIIEKLSGHHEPQEEKVFYEIIKRLDPSPTMIELGSFWAYYSNWLAYEDKSARIICCEPDPKNMLVGKKNVELNGNLDRATFIESAAGSVDGSVTQFELDSEPGKMSQFTIRSIDGIAKERSIPKFDIVHMDVQGAELDALYGAKEMIAAGKVRFLIISTHHYIFSNDPATHQKCKAQIEEWGGNIIAAHTVQESFSGDGLIAASFDKRDEDFRIELSINSSDNSLFRPYEKDLELLFNKIRNNE